MMSISTIAPGVTVKAMTAKGRSPEETTKPAPPLTIAGRDGREPAEEQGLRGDLGRAVDLEGAGERSPGRGGVATDDDVGVENVEEGLEVAGSGRGEEGVDELPLAGHRHRGRGRGRSPDPSAGSARELTRRGRRPLHDRGEPIEELAVAVPGHPESSELLQSGRIGGGASDGQLVAVELAAVPGGAAHHEGQRQALADERHEDDDERHDALRRHLEDGDDDRRPLR